MASPLIDIDRVRQETRGCGHVVHLNNAGSSLMPRIVADTLTGYLEDEELRGGYETADARQADLENFYDASARLLNCSRDEVAFVENATRAWDMAFYSFQFEPGDRILTTVSEYGSNVIAYLQQAERAGAKVEFVPDDESGQIDVDALANAIDERVKLISISHIPTGGGLVNPAVEVGKVARQAGVPYLLDACQSAGQLPLDVHEIGCDMLSGTGRKYLRGPRGTGFLYVRRGLAEELHPPLLDQFAADLTGPDAYRIRPDTRRFENWERYFAGQVALGTAMDYAMELGLPAIWSRIEQLAARLREGLSAIPGVQVVDQGETRCGIVTFVADGHDAGDIKSALAADGINVSVSDGSGNLVSYQRRGLTRTVRASVHYFNTDQELAQCLNRVESTVRG